MEDKNEHIFVKVRTNAAKALELGKLSLEEGSDGDSSISEIIIMNPRDEKNRFARLVYARLPRGGYLHELFLEKKNYQELTESEFKEETNYELLDSLSKHYRISITEISMGKHRSRRRWRAGL